MNIQINMVTERSSVQVYFCNNGKNSLFYLQCSSKHTSYGRTWLMLSIMHVVKLVADIHFVVFIVSSICQLSN